MKLKKNFKKLGFRTPAPFRAQTQIRGLQMRKSPAGRFGGKGR